MARPTKYNSSMLINAQKFAKVGMTDVQMALALGVSKATFNNWKKDYPEFLDSIKKAKTGSDEAIVNSLHKRASGFTHDGKYYPPDPVSMIFWLKNRQSEDWRDKQEHDHNLKNWPDSITVKIVNG